MDDLKDLKLDLLGAIGLGLLAAKEKGTEFGGRLVDFAELHDEDPKPERGRVALFVGMTDGTMVGITVCDVPVSEQETQ